MIKGGSTPSALNHWPPQIAPRSDALEARIALKRVKYGLRLTALLPKVTFMGNIRPNYIKRIALELVQKYPTVFNADFDNNKILVSKLTNVESIMMRNRIAGYVTTYWQHMEK